MPTLAKMFNTENNSPAPTDWTARLAASRWAWVIPAAIIVGTAALRLAGIDKSLWIDEVHTLRHMQAANFVASLRNDIHPPLYFALLKLAYQAGDSIPWLRLVSAGSGIGAVAVCCFFFRGRERLAGWITGLLLATLPGFMANSQELRQYALLSLCLVLSLFFAWRLLQSPRSTATLVGLTGSLAAAAATHLITVFFLMALTVVLGWHLRHERYPVLLRLAAAMTPAACLILWIKLLFVFHLRPDQWWMPAVSPGMLLEIFSEGSGWNTFPWLAAAWERHVSHTGIIVMIGSIVSTAFVLWTAWGRRQAGLAHSFLAIALIYWMLMIAYSMLALPVIWPRTVLPGMLPFIVGLGWGIATHPHARRRAWATASIVLLALAMTVPWLRGLAFRPIEDLRGFALAGQSAAQPGTLLILVGEVEIGIEPYWPEYRQASWLRLNLDAPDPLPEISATLGRQPPNKPALLLFRADLYLAEQQATLDRVVAHLAAALAPPTTVWVKDGYHILRFAPAN